MKKILLPLLFLLFPLTSYALVFKANQLLPDGSFGVVMATSTSPSAYLSASSSPTLGSITATSTTATSTLQNTSITGAISLLGEYFTNFSTYVHGLFSGTSPITVSGSGVIACPTCSTVANATSTNYWYANGTGIYNANSGNVGVGTAAPQAKLQVLSSGSLPVDTDSNNEALVTGPDHSTSGNLANLFIESNSTATDGFGGTIGFGGQYSGTNVADFARIAGVRQSGSFTGAFTISTRNLSTAMVEALRVDKNQNVAIGTTSPASKLHVYVASNSFQIPSIIENDNGGSGSANLGFSVVNNTTEALSEKAGIGLIRNQVNGQGNLILYNRGVNDTANFQSGDEALTIGGVTSGIANVSINNSTLRYPLTVRTATDKTLQIRTGVSDGNAVALSTTNDADTLNIPMEFRGSKYNFASGNVGIGIATPAYEEHIFGTGQTTAALTDAGNKGGSLLISDAGAGAGNGGALLFSAVVGNGNLPQAAIKTLLTDGTANGKGDFAFSTRNATGDTALTERMRILAGGNVGIGTAGPNKKLEIFDTDPASIALGTANFRINGSGGNTYLDFGRSNTLGVGWLQSQFNDSGTRSLLLNPLGGNVGIGTTTPVTVLHLAVGGSGDGLRVQNSNTTVTRYADFGFNASTDHAFINFLTAGSEGRNFDFNYNGTTKMSLSPAGNFGVGTTSPYATLSVQSGASTGDAFAVATTTGALIGGYDNDGHRFTAGPTPAITNGTDVGDDNGGTITTGIGISSVTMTFSKAYRQVPYCKVTDDSLTISADVSAISTTAVTFSLSAPITTGHLYYECAYHHQ